MTSSSAAPDQPAPDDRAVRRAQRNSRLVLLLLALALPPGLIVLYRVEPAEGSFYPPCPFYWATGLHCAGCGSTRCLHALLHGDLRQALAFNVFALLAVPYLAYWFVRECLTAFFDAPPSRHLPEWAVRLLVALVFVFWVVRNLPFPPFDSLAPPQRRSTTNAGTVEPLVVTSPSSAGGFAGPFARLPCSR